MNRTAARAHGDRGVVLILVASAMVGILGITALVIDLGAKRAARGNDQAVADLASLAAASFLAGDGGETVAPNAYLACRAAVTSATTNVPDFQPTQSPTSACAAFPADANTGCSSVTAPVDAVFSDATHRLTVRFPIPGDELSDGRFAGAGANDGTNRCERMRITYSSTSPTSFARILGVDEQTTEASSVVRASSSQLAQGVAALLLLERVGCGALQNSGQAAVVVRAPSPEHPGVIQSDSAGQVGPCSSNSNADGYVIWGPQLPSGAGGGPSITAETSSGGIPGIIGIFSLSLPTPGRGGAVFPDGLNVAPVRASIGSRQAVDDKYNGTGGQIASLHSTAYNRTGWSAAAALASGYSVVTGTQPCRGLTIPALTLAATKVFFDCATYEPDVNIFPNATDVIARGSISIRNGKVLSLPRLRRLSVRGDGTTALDVQGKLLVNTGESVIAGPDAYANGLRCTTRRGPGGGGAVTDWAELATFNGEIWIRGQARLCQTFVYMGRNQSSYARQTVTATGVAPESYPALTRCAPTLPCPKDGVDTSWPIRITGGGAATDWSAPNQLSQQPLATDLAANPFEDLALWSETSSGSVEMKGQAGSLAEGVFFLPNASALFQGQGSQPIQLNAQFLVRRLNLSGQGSMTLSPNVSDSVLTPVPGAVAIIR